MTSGDTEAFATWLSAAEAKRIHEALDQTDLSKSDLIARGVRYYIEENPDGVPAFRPDDYEMDPLEKAGILPPENDADWTAIEDR
jgi:hypothetical protein